MEPSRSPPQLSRPGWYKSRASACAPLPPGYRPRDVESSPLHRAVRLHRSAFAAAARRRGHVVPRVVERELDGVVGMLGEPLRPVPVDMFNGDKSSIKVDTAWRPAYWYAAHRAICYAPEAGA